MLTCTVYPENLQLMIFGAMSVAFDLHQGPRFCFNYPLSDSHPGIEPLGYDHILQTFGVSKLNHAAYLRVLLHPELLS